MDAGVVVPHMGRAAGPAAISDVAQAAEDLGFASIWVSDHVILPASYESAYPFSTDGSFPMANDRPFLDPFPALGFCTAVTERVRIGVSVCIIPHRHPVVLAKAVATLDALSQGRFTLGVGVGWLREEFDALDAPFERRGAFTDEALAFLRHAWSDEQPVSFHGEFVDVEDVYFSPRPVQDQVPLWVGGTAPASLARAARFGASWHPHLGSMGPERLQQVAEQVRTRSRDAGRQSHIGVALYVPLDLREDSEAGEPPWETGLMAGTPADLVAWLRRYERAGVDHLVLALPGGPQRRIETMQVLMRDVLPAVDEG